MVSPTSFALTLENNNANVYIDYNYVTSINIFNYTTKKIQYTFDGECKSINLFNEKIPERINKPGCMETVSNIFMIQDTKRNQSHLISIY